MKFTHTDNIPLALKVFLAHDEYDHSDDPKVISATGIMRPVKAIILGNRLEPGEGSVALPRLVASRTGTSIHNGLEAAWLSPNLEQYLVDLGYPAGWATSVRVNPENPSEEHYNVFLEMRSEREIAGHIISGKFDMVINGMVCDLKTTGTFSWTKDPKDYIMQLSIYRWLNPDIITEDVGEICFYFRDWKAHMVNGKKPYPPAAMCSKQFQLLEPAEVESYLMKKLSQVSNMAHLTQSDLPQCTQEELWQNPPKYAYMASPTSKKAGKLSENFMEVQNYLLQKGTGRIETRFDEPTACLYCPVFHICEHAASFVACGALKL